VKRIEYDLFYIENWSIGFDLYILVRTVFAVLVPRNAF
jgi:lipopolysaccharide/colanic/teichoic acid biosynthesis glycosyltransferase